MAVPLSQARWILFAICILIVAINLDYTSVNLALVSMAAEVDSDLNIIQWALSAYVLAWAASIVLAGRLADIFGKRRILLYGVGLFALSSLLIGMGTSTELIIGGRVLQGIGGALFVPSLYALTFSSFPPEKALERGPAAWLQPVGTQERSGVDDPRVQEHLRARR